MAVEINVDLDSTKAHGKIELLEKRLKSVGDDLNLDFGIDDDLKDKIDQITQQLKEINIDVDYEDLEKAAALKAMLQGDIETDLKVNSDKALAEIRDSLDPPDGGGGVDHDGQAKKFAAAGTREGAFMDRMKRILDGGGTPNVNAPHTLNSRQSRMRGMMEDRRRFFAENNVSYDFPSRGGDSGVRRMSATSGRRAALITGVKKNIRGLIPDMNTFYNLLAAIIPIIIVMGAQLLGVAAAMGAVAIAGASILALGLIGHGEDMASSWKKAKEQMQELKQAMFDTFQPTMQTFAPIQARFFDAIPEQLNKVASAMEGLTVYSDTLFAALRGISDWVANGISGMVKYEAVLSQLALRFGEIVGTSINDFLRFLVKEAYNSQEMLIQLGVAFRDLAVGAYNILKVLVRVLVVFRPLATLFAYIGDLLNNKLVVGVLAFVGTLALTIYMAGTLAGVIGGLASIWAGGLMATIVSSVYSLQMFITRALMAQLSVYGLTGAVASLVSWLTLGVGAALAMGAAMNAMEGITSQMEMTTGWASGAGGGGMLGSSSGYGGGAGSGTTQQVINHGNTYNMEVHGDLDNASEQGLKDIVQREGDVKNARQPPSPGGA